MMTVQQEPLRENRKIKTYPPDKPAYGTLIEYSEGTSGTKKETSQNLPVMNPMNQVVTSDIDRFQAWLTLSFVFVLNATTLGSLKIYALIFQDVVSQKYYTREEASWPIASATTIQNLAGKSFLANAPANRRSIPVSGIY